MVSGRGVQLDSLDGLVEAFPLDALRGRSAIIDFSADKFFASLLHVENQFYLSADVHLFNDSLLHKRGLEGYELLFLKAMQSSLGLASHQFESSQRQFSNRFSVLTYRLKRSVDALPLGSTRIAVYSKIDHVEIEYLVANAFSPLIGRESLRSPALAAHGDLADDFSSWFPPRSEALVLSDDVYRIPEPVSLFEYVDSVVFTDDLKEFSADYQVEMSVSYLLNRLCDVYGRIDLFPSLSQQAQLLILDQEVDQNVRDGVLRAFSKYSLG